ncbi:PDSS1 [Cordylochernes scorpioides]|uniref:PDSS1 n=1 Tax=Cordylochernes scorpioides TaxID=51811 RepID=A0ABY6JV88_9ARAC|nr:PDSS1 [Cordylochernes scorpioides]
MVDLVRRESQELYGDDGSSVEVSHPPALAFGYAAVPKISWDEVGALDKVKELLKKLILRQVELAGQSEENMTQTSGILLYGPPGTGKTMIAKALANEANLNFLAIKGPELLNMYLGESERMLKECFERAQNSAPCVLFFDEIDTLCPARKDHRNDASSRLVGTMLTQMSGITPLSQVYLVATTNRPDSLDPALTRSGRFSTHLYVGLPNPEERYQILKAILSKRTTLLGPQLDLRAVAHKCHNYSGSDLHELVTQALNIHIACKQDISRLQLTDFQLSTLHFKAAMHLVKPSNSEDSLSFSKLSIPSDALQSEGSKKRKRESDVNSHLARPAKIPASVLQQEDAGMISSSQPNAELTQTDQFETIISQLVSLSQSSSQPPGSLEPSQGIEETTVSEESPFSKYLFNKPPQSDEEYDPLIPNMPPDHELHLLDGKKLLKFSIHASCCFSPMPFNKSILVHGPSGTGKRTFIRAYGALNIVRVLPLRTNGHCPSVAPSPPALVPESCDPFKMAAADIAMLYRDIVQEFQTEQSTLRQAAGYYFDGQGKAFRPAMVVLMSRALNQHVGSRSSGLRDSQHTLAMIVEMLHTASLVHDDVVDVADTRRSKPSVNRRWGVKKAVLSGDYILGVTGMLLASIDDDGVTDVITQAMKDLVDGELMQLEPPGRDEDRFAHYLQKTYNKTASLLSNACKAAAILAGADPELQEAAFQYGRHVGIAFQLIDDLLDFVASQQELGKPAAADLNLGLATGPVLFAAETEATGYTPFFLVHARLAETYIDAVLPYLPDDISDDYFGELVIRAEEARKLSRSRLLQSQAKDRRLYDQKHTPVYYQKDAIVWVFTPIRKVGLSEKLLKRFFGPYKVTKKLSEVTYEVEPVNPSPRS